MRDFRRIRIFEREWKQVDEQMQSMKSGGSGIEEAMKGYLEELGESGTY